MKMIKCVLLYLICIGIVTGCTNDPIKEKNKKINIAVSIVPQETFVKAVGGDLVKVTTMITPGNSPANYEPTPREMINLSKSKVYFTINVPTEKSNILPKLKELNNNIKIIQLDKEVKKKYEPIILGSHGHRENDDSSMDLDPHIWLSPKRVIVMINTIKDTLIDIDYENKHIYIKNAQDYIDKLTELDRNIKTNLENYKGKSFFIYHPAFSYFAKDYNLNMITIEENGKEGTGKRIKEIIDRAKEKNAKFIFYQEEFHGQQAKVIGNEIGAIPVKVAPLSPEYISNMNKIASKFKDALK